MRILAVLAVAVLIAGCSDPKDKVEPFTCPDGTVIDADDMDGNGHTAHEHGGADPSMHCPVAPSVTLGELPANATAYVPITFAWSVDGGSDPHAHSMLTSIRVSATSVDDSALAAPESFGEELVKREHNTLPASFTIPETFTQSGTYYIRAYAEVTGEPYWSPEHAIAVSPAAATGTVVTLTKEPGLVAGAFGPTESDLGLGDAIEVVNSDVVEHTFVWGENPGGLGNITVAAGATSPPVVFTVPGGYKLVTDDAAQPKTVTIVVR